jgi:hypothetical protein
MEAVQLFEAGENEVCLSKTQVGKSAVGLCERSEAIQAQAVQPGRLSGGRLCLDCFAPHW